MRELDVSGKAAVATVRGTRNYRVEIDLDDDEFESSCTCPYEFGGYCKHIVATLLALAKDYDGIVGRSESEARRLDAALRSMDAEQLRGFLRKEFSRVKGLKERFMIQATGETKAGGRSVEDYKEEVGSLYEEASAEDGYIEYGNEVDFSPVFDLGERYKERRNFAEAAKVYQAVSEVIAEKMDEVDDSDGYYGDRFWEALEGLSSCVSSLTGEGKVGYVDYLFDRLVRADPDYFQDAYDEALRRICVSKEDLERLRKLLEPRLPGSLPDERGSWHRRYMSFVFLGLQAFILDGLANLGDDQGKTELYDLYGKYYLKDEDFCLLYAERLEKDGKLDEAIEVAEEGLRVYNSQLGVELRHFLDEHYEALPPEKYEENLKRLFYQELDWRYYERLKKLAGTRWDRTLEELVGHFSSSRGRYDDDGGRDVLIEIYLKEKMFDEALKEVVKARSVRTLSKYYRQLAERYPADYFRAYKELISSDLDRGTGRDYYREIASHLRKMKDIKGFEGEFAEFIRILREKFPRRRAFLDEIKRL